MKRHELTAEMFGAVVVYEERFTVHFSQFFLLSAPVLTAYVNTNYESFASRITIARDTNPQVGALVARLTVLANQPELTSQDRHVYRDTLERIFQTLPAAPNGMSPVIAPRREGAILAHRLGWLRSEHVEPHLKRIPFEGGLLVGCDSGLKPGLGSSIEIVDGALATGATAMAILAICRPSEVRLFCAHATTQGLAALIRFATGMGVNLRCIVGDASGVLNDHFYAVLPEDSGRVCVGDVGDTIAPLEIIGPARGD